MPDLQISPLAPAQRPLLDKFYRAQRSPMRAGQATHLWVARRDEIIAGLCLSPVENGHWLTSLWVASHARGRGVASRLLQQVIARTEGPIWLFCHPDLQMFYQRQGFHLKAPLPGVLAERLKRYQQSKPLVSLGTANSRNPT
jgi:GNAT superfamily N-acetyltransferase